MWISEFKREDVTPLVGYEPRPVTESGREDVVSTKRMCFSCHDGFVLDSRFMWKEETHGHPVGQEPSEHITIPVVEGKRVFPLNEDGRVYCGTCHSAHGVDWGQTESTVFMRAKSAEGKLCTICHEDHSKGPDKGDHPIFKSMDPFPARLLEAGAKLRSDGTLLCQSCHRPHGAVDDKLMIVDNDGSQLCGLCHTDRYAADRESANEAGTHPVNVVADGFTLPAVLEEQGAKLGKTGKLVCQSCHRVHNAGTDESLLVASNERSSLCATCHEAQRIVAGGKHDMSLVDANAENVREQKVGTGGVCSACHLPHGGVGPRMWAQPLGEGKDRIAALCTSCHGADGLARRHLVGAYSHPVGVRLGRAAAEIELPLFTAGGARATRADGGLVSCATCHDPHRWDPAHAERDAKPGEPGTASDKFLRKSNAAGSSLCLDCHRDKRRVDGSAHDLAVSAPGERNVRGQSAARSGVCGACHVVHNAAGDLLWARRLDGKSDASSRTCTTCHNPRGPAAEKEVGRHSHPVGVGIDALPLRVRGGKWSKAGAFPGSPSTLEALPLYDKRGRRVAGGGNVGCASCHDPHAGAPAGREKSRRARGDPRASFLRIANDGASALCVNCHVDKAAVARSRHDVDDDAVVGVCAKCHLPHNARGPVLWSRSTGKGDGAVEALCADCHRSGGAAEKMLTGAHSHPIGVRLRKSMRDGGLPTFADDGTRSSSGKIDCATCHDPHRWAPAGGASKTVARDGQEGDAANSFLRVSAVPSGELCVRCHRRHRAVQGTDHDLNITAPDAVNRHGQKPAQSGLCGQCHTPHNAFESSMLWARYLDDETSGDVAERRCRGCHQSGAIAGTKVPIERGHPATVSAWSTGLRRELLARPVPDMPVYSRSGKKVRTGAVTCPTCHEPHRWGPANAASGKGVNAEGDVRTSFLRIGSSEGFLCADCHGADSLFRYKYFHGEASRVKHHLFH